MTDTVASVQSSSGPTGSTRYSVVNLDGSSLNVNGAVQVAALPAVGSNAVMIDLTSALRDESLADYYSTRQVWLSAAAGSGTTVISRLRAEHIRVLSVQTARSRGARVQTGRPDARLRAVSRRGPGERSARNGIAAVRGGRRDTPNAPSRRWPFTRSACHDGPSSGPWRASSASWRQQVSSPAAAAGTAAARFSLPSVPEFTGLPPGPTLVYTLPVASLLAVVGAAAVLLVVAIAVSIAMVNSASTPDKLRISQR